MILLDASGLFAALVPDEPQHVAARRVLEQDSPPFILSPFVLGEVDYLLAQRGGPAQELEFLGEVWRGAYELVASGDVERSAAVVEQHREHNVGLADASIVVLAGRCGTNRVLTLDQRHFRVLRTPSGEPFTVLPADT